MNTPTTERKPLEVIKKCRRCGHRPFLSRGHNLFFEPGDVITILQCPACKVVIQGYSDEEAINMWNERQEPEGGKQDA